MDDHISREEFLIEFFGSFEVFFVKPYRNIYIYGLSNDNCGE